MLLMLGFDDLHPAIRDACASRFASQHYSDGVQQAAIALRDLVRERGGAELRTLDGDDLMGKAFNPKNPRIVVADLGTQTGQSIQRGMLLLAQGAVAALRNPAAHERLDLDLSEAMEMVATLSLVARRVQGPSPPFEATVEFIDQIASDLDLRKTKARTGWVYSLELGGQGVGVYNTKPDLQFHLDRLRTEGAGQEATEIVRRIEDLTGKSAARSWPNISCEEVMAASTKVRETLIEPYFQALRAAIELDKVTGTIEQIAAKRTPRRGMELTEALIRRDDGTLIGVVWFNQPQLAKQLHPGDRLFLAGTLRPRRYGPGDEMQNPHHELLTPEAP